MNIKDILEIEIVPRHAAEESIKIDGSIITRFESEIRPIGRELLGVTNKVIHIDTRRQIFKHTGIFVEEHYELNLNDCDVVIITPKSEYRRSQNG